MSINVLRHMLVVRPSSAAHISADMYNGKKMYSCDLTLTFSFTVLEDLPDNKSTSSSSTAGGQLHCSKSAMKSATSVYQA